MVRPESPAGNVHGNVTHARSKAIARILGEVSGLDYSCIFTCHPGVHHIELDQLALRRHICSLADACDLLRFRQAGKGHQAAAFLGGIRTGCFRISGLLHGQPLPRLSRRFTLAISFLK